MLAYRYHGMALVLMIVIAASIIIVNVSLIGVAIITLIYLFYAVKSVVINVKSSVLRNVQTESQRLSSFKKH